MPAPCSIKTVWPREVRIATPDGVMPTRNSCVLISLGTPMRMEGPSILSASSKINRTKRNRIDDATRLHRRALADGRQLPIAAVGGDLLSRTPHVDAVLVAVVVGLARSPRHERWIEAEHREEVAFDQDVV